MSINLEDVKRLREMTGAGMMSAKKALEEAGGDMDKAIEVLRKAGEASAAKKSSRAVGSGLVDSYVHGGKIGVLVEVNCETDFVARTDDFKQFVHDLAMHVAATDPEYLDPESVPEAVVEKEKEIYRAELTSQSKPAEIVENIIQGKLEKYYQGICLIKQPFIKDDSKTIEDLTKEMIAKLGENIVIRRFSRIELGGE